MSENPRSKSVAVNWCLFLWMKMANSARGIETDSVGRNGCIDRLLSIKPVYGDFQSRLRIRFATLNFSVFQNSELRICLSQSLENLIDFSFFPIILPMPLPPSGSFSRYLHGEWGDLLEMLDRYF